MTAIPNSVDVVANKESTKIRPIKITPPSETKFATPSGLSVIAVTDDPKEERPFHMEYSFLTPEQAATAAYAVLTVLRNATPSDMETEKAIDVTLNFLMYRANLGLLPF